MRTLRLSLLVFATQLLVGFAAAYCLYKFGDMPGAVAFVAGGVAVAFLLGFAVSKTAGPEGVAAALLGTLLVALPVSGMFWFMASGEKLAIVTAMGFLSIPLAATIGALSVGHPTIARLGRPDNAV
jgi:hypothetical protein